VANLPMLLLGAGLAEGGEGTGVEELPGGLNTAGVSRWGERGGLR
jgi:hypothetical protein